MLRQRQHNQADEHVSSRFALFLTVKSEIMFFSLYLEKKNFNIDKYFEIENYGKRLEWI